MLVSKPLKKKPHRIQFHLRELPAVQLLSRTVCHEKCTCIYLSRFNTSLLPLLLVPHYTHKSCDLITSCLWLALNLNLLWLEKKLCCNYPSVPVLDRFFSEGMCGKYPLSTHYWQHESTILEISSLTSHRVIWLWQFFQTQFLVCI